MLFYEITEMTARGKRGKGPYYEELRGGVSVTYYFSYWCHLGEEMGSYVVGFRKRGPKSS